MRYDASYGLGMLGGGGGHGYAGGGGSEVTLQIPHISNGVDQRWTPNCSGVPKVKNTSAPSADPKITPSPTAAAVLLIDRSINNLLLIIDY